MYSYKKIILYFIMFCLAPAASARKTGTIAVVQFENRSDQIKDDKDSWRFTHILQSKLAESSIVQVAERLKIQQVIEEQKLQMTGLTDQEMSVSLGKLVGAQRIVVGEYQQPYRDWFNVSVRLVDVENGRIERQWVKDEVSRKNIEPMLSQIVKEILGVIQFESAIETVAQLHNPQKSFHIHIECAKDTLKIGEIYNFSIRPDSACYITLLDIGTSGAITVLFPNKMQPRNFVGANQVITTPNLKVGAPAGLEKVKIIATKENIPLIDMVKLTGGTKSFLGVDDKEAPDFSKDLEMIITPLNTDNWSETSLDLNIVE